MPVAGSAKPPILLQSPKISEADGNCNVLIDDIRPEERRGLPRLLKLPTPAHLPGEVSSEPPPLKSRIDGCSLSFCRTVRPTLLLTVVLNPAPPVGKPPSAEASHNHHRRSRRRTTSARLRWWLA